ncbi:MAG: LysR family transcriptional regulator [Chloroflexi bacterium]|nr:LysR family transcriptional regulator [Chloroflexota bacterium]
MNSNINLNQLFYFSAVGRSGSYSRAAEELSVSQPDVYRSVKRLEKECGVKLLERHGKGVCLTQGGRALYEYAAQMASLKNLAEEAVAAQKGLMSGTVSIGASCAVASNLLPSMLGRWMDARPNVEVHVVLGQSEQLQDLLLKGAIDALIGSGLNWRPGLQRQVIFSDSVEVVCCSGHRLAGSGLISIKKLSRERLIVPPRGNGTRDELDQIEIQYGVRFKIALEVNRQEVIKRLCRAGLGIALLPRSVIDEEIANKQLCLLQVEGFPRTRLCFLVLRAGKVLAPEIRSLLAAVDSWASERQARQSLTRAPHPPGEKTFAVLNERVS